MRLLCQHDRNALEWASQELVGDEDVALAACCGEGRDFGAVFLDRVKDDEKLLLKTLKSLKNRADIEEDQRTSSHLDESCLRVRQSRNLLKKVAKLLSPKHVGGTSVCSATEVESSCSSSTADGGSSGCCSSVCSSAEPCSSEAEDESGFDETRAPRHARMSSSTSKTHASSHNKKGRPQKTMPSPHVLNERSCAEVAVQLCGANLEFLGPEMRADRDIVLKAVQNCGSALQFAADELRRDPLVVLEAVNQDPSSLRYSLDVFHYEHPDVRNAILAPAGTVSPRG